MSQTTGAISSKDYKIETSTNGSSWEDQSGIAMKLEPSGGERATGEGFTFDGDTPIITGGKRAGVTVNVEYVYTEGASDFFEDVRTAYEAGSAFYIRWSPKGGQTGEFVFTTDAGIVKSLKYPAGDAASGDPVISSFDLHTPKITKSVAS
jgi:hypothetical protein